MNLFEFCEMEYNKGNRAKLNGIRATPDRVAGMVAFVYRVYVSHLEDKKYLPDIDTLLKMEVFENEKFNKNKMEDLIALVFDVITERNHNPKLWSLHQEIKIEVSQIFNVLFNGQMASVYSDGVGSIGKMGDSYHAAKKILEADLESPFKDLY